MPVPCAEILRSCEPNVFKSGPSIFRIQAVDMPAYEQRRCRGSSRGPLTFHQEVGTLQVIFPCLSLFCLCNSQMLLAICLVYSFLLSCISLLQKDMCISVLYHTAHMAGDFDFIWAVGFHFLFPLAGLEVDVPSLLHLGLGPVPLRCCSWDSLETSLGRSILLLGNRW